MNEMSEAFVAYVRFEEKLLLLRRSKSDGDFPALWDGVWGIGDTPKKFLPEFQNPLESQSNLSTTKAQALSVVLTWAVLLVDVVPVLVVSSTDEVTPTGRYTRIRMD